MDSHKGPRPDRLLVRDWNGKSVTVRLDKDSFILGRSPACELSYSKNTFLSRQHLAISKHDGVWKVEDLGSLNGSSLNGKKLSQPTELRVGDYIEAGQLTIEVAGEDSTAVADPDR